jgi:uncharacterized protein (TIGR03435 family)
MPDANDMDLVRDYARQNSESAFAELVRRHINLVYSVAMRFTGNPGDADDVTQAVFILLARKAAGLSDRTVLTGWLYETTRLTAAGFLRAQNRRRFWEQEACMQSNLNAPETGNLWRQLSPHLEAAMSRLAERDRTMLALRFYENKTTREVAAALQLTEAAAHKRTARALEKLRRFFSQRGVDSTAAAIAENISAHSIQVAPVTLAKAVTTVALAKGATASISTLTLMEGALKIMAWTKAKTAILAGAVLLLAAGTTTVTVEKIHEDKIEKLWRVNKDVPAALIDKLPPMVKVLPTKFAPVWVNWNSGSNGDKFTGADARASVIAAYAYGFPQGRIMFPGGEPTNRFDFVATLPQGSREALQRGLKAKLGLVGHRATENMDVLLLKVNRANAPGLKPAIPEKNDTYSKTGVYHSSNVAIATGAPRFEGLAYYLERYFKMPVIDQTGLTQYFSIDLRWKEESGSSNPEGLKQDLLDKLGLELVPTNMPVEILVVEKAK